MQFYVFSAIPETVEAESEQEAAQKYGEAKRIDGADVAVLDAATANGAARWFAVRSVRVTSADPKQLPPPVSDPSVDPVV